jgi:hypothetical protein
VWPPVAARAPKAWLGTAYHEVLEKIVTAEARDGLDEAAEKLWNEALPLNTSAAWLVLWIGALVSRNPGRAITSPEQALF